MTDDNTIDANRDAASLDLTTTATHAAHSHHGEGSPELIMDEAFWDERYGSSPALWSGNPNPHLLTEVSELSPGTALDVGCGEGADTIWLAERGWRVSAVDISTVALERGAAGAMKTSAETADRITWIHADLLDWTPAPESFDLVSIHFMHFPQEQRERLYRRMAEAVAPGGMFLVVAHHPSDLETTMPRPRVRDLFFTADQLAAQLDRRNWEIVVTDARARSASDPDGNVVTIHDAVLRARKRGG